MGFWVESRPKACETCKDHKQRMSLTSEFEDIAMVHLNNVYRAAVAFCGDRNLAEDLVQITFLKAFENFASFKKGTNCKAWLIRILRNTWFDHIRRQKFCGKQLPLDEQLVAAKPCADEDTCLNTDDIMENFSDEQVIKALRQLPEDQRTALFLTDVEGFSQEVTARIMNVAVGTIKSRTSRARRALKVILASYAEEMRLTGGDK